MNIVKRVVYLFPVLALAMALCTGQVSAANDIGNDDYDENTEWLLPWEYDVPADAPLSGMCGDDLTWSITWDDNHNYCSLLISGTGEMYDFNGKTRHYREYAKYSERITSVIIEEGVTSIGSNAFQSFEKLKKISFPKSLERIGELALNDTAWLENEQKNNDFVIVNDILLKGKSGAFHSQIGVYDDVVIPDGIRYIAPRAFYCISGNDVILPDSVIEIADYAFYNSLIRGVKFGNGLKVIGKSAFRYSNDLKKVTIPDCVEVMGDCAFYYCEELEKVNVGNGVKRIEKQTFDQCKMLSKVTLNEGLEYIGESVFHNCDLKTITIPSTVNYIEDSAFSGCSDMLSATFLGDVPEKGKCSFCKLINCDIYYPKGNSTWCDINDIETHYNHSSYDYRDIKNCWFASELDKECTEHTPGEKILSNSKESTCIEDGINQYIVRCKECNKKYTVETEIIPQTGHVMNSVIAEPAHDGERGRICHTCEVCGYSFLEPYYEGESIDYCSHDFAVVSNEGRPATCSEKGYIKKYYCCTLCGRKTESSVQILDKKEHLYTIEVIEAKDYENGSIIRRCLICGDTKITETPMLSHTPNWKKQNDIADTKPSETVKDFVVSEPSEIVTDKRDAVLSARSAQEITYDKVKSYKASVLKKKGVSFKINAKSSGDGVIAYKVTKGKSKYISVNKKGKVSLKKGIKKGKYEIKITALESDKCTLAEKIVTIKVK